jgi:hypothetical protein
MASILACERVRGFRRRDEISAWTDAKRRPAGASIVTSTTDPDKRGIGEVTDACDTSVAPDHADQSAQRTRQA